MEFYRQSSQDVLKALNSSTAGLSAAEATTRQQKIGLNELHTATPINPLYIFISQFKNFIIYILLFAVCFALLIGEYADSLIILAILLTNAIIGFFQELSAHRSLEALKKLSALKATVLRDNQRVSIDAKLLVPGDIVHLEAGDKVPADARIIDSVRLKVEEATLTGESVPAEKMSDALLKDAQIGDQHNMLFSSTAVVTGNGNAVIVATGMETEIGKITELIKETKEEMTPLQRRLHRFGKKLGAIVITICFVVFFLFASKELMAGSLTAGSLVAFVFIAISLAVAAVPTALPAVVTIALSIGVKKLLHKKALVRKLSSVETLGSCDVICTDKTGTLTENQMTVRYGWTLAGEASLSGIGYSPEGNVSHPLNPLLYKIGQLCNNASLQDSHSGWHIIGDPTEGALLTSAAKAKIYESASRLDELPFDSNRKLMSVSLKNQAGNKLMYTKGAPGQLLSCCTKVQLHDEVVPLTLELKEIIEEQNDEYASKALRVLAFAYKSLDETGGFVEQELIFVGLQAMIDPPRADVIESIQKTKEAGIRVIMATGDYQATAKAIGKEIGISGNVCSGEEFEGMDNRKLLALLRQNTNIFARVVPEHKQRIIIALQQMGHTVAMTGDGVNDAPALKKANIGVAVGSGTEVAKEASDFVLLDDSFTHIVNAIEEGRGIYDNIQKSIMLLLSGNVGEVLIIFMAALLGMNLPLTAILLLWINMVTDGAPALAYTVDPYGVDIMSRKPKPLDENILPGRKLALIGILGTVGTIFAISLFSMFGGRSTTNEELIIGQTMVFNFVVLYEVILIFVIRKDYQVPLFTNKWVWAAAILSLGLQALLMYTPARHAFKIAALGTTELLALGITGLFFYLASLLYHYLARRNGMNAQKMM